MNENTNKTYYPFSYLHHYAYTVGIYGNEKPVVVKGPLVLRTYYRDQAKTIIDVRHTSAYYADELFYETNKALREARGETINSRRDLAEIPVPGLDDQYHILYNLAEVPSGAFDDRLAIVSYWDPDAVGVGVIIRHDTDKGIQYLTESEARSIVQKLNEVNS